MDTGFINIPWGVWGGLSLVVAAIFVFFVPRADKVDAAKGFQHTAARWFHSLCWLLIAANFFVRTWGTEGAGGIANLLALAGALAYIVYINTFLRLARR